MKETNDFTEEIRFLLPMSFKVRFAQSGPKPRSMRSYYQVGRYRNMNLDFSSKYVIGFYFKIIVR